MYKIKKSPEDSPAYRTPAAHRRGHSAHPPVPSRPGDAAVKCAACGCRHPRKGTCGLILIRYRLRGCPPGDACAQFPHRAKSIDAYGKAAAAPE